VRTLVWLVVFAVACGGKKPARDDAAVRDAAVNDAAIAPACANPSSGTTVTMREVGAVGNPAVLVTSPPNDPRLFVVEQRGAIRIIEDGQLRPAPFLDISDDRGGPVVDGGELGLLGLAFDPAFATTGEFYVTYTSLITQRTTTRSTTSPATGSARRTVASPIRRARWCWRCRGPGRTTTAA
jgi:hypothetical protein